jgi:DNA replication protein DnaC
MNQENEFDRFVKKHGNILNSIPPLTEKERQEMHLRKEKQQSQNLEGMSEMDKALYFARKNKRCVALAACFQAIAEQNTKEWKEKTTVGGRQIFRQVSKKMVQQMDLIEAKEKFWNMYLKDSVYPNEYEVDKLNAPQLDQLVKYFIQDPSCKLDLNKGIAICGSIGSGKTEIMKQLSFFCTDNDFETAFKMKSMREYVKEVGTAGLSATTEYLQGDYCFDDIAVSAPNITHYGTQINPLDDLIQGRYDRFTKRNSKPTHFTMNLNFNPNTQAAKELIEKIYDPRSIDRIRQMCNFVYLGGQSRRK